MQRLIPETSEQSSRPKATTPRASCFPHLSLAGAVSLEKPQIHLCVSRHLNPAPAEDEATLAEGSSRKYTILQASLPAASKVFKPECALESRENCTEALGETRAKIRR